MVSQDEYRGTFGPSLVINFTLEATTQSITYQRPHHTPPPHPLWSILLLQLLHNQSHISSRITHPPHLRPNSTRIGPPQSSSELLSLDWTSSISFRNQFIVLELLFPIPHSRSSPNPRSSARDGSSSIPTGAPMIHCTLLTPPLFGAPALGWALLNPIGAPLCLDWLSSISFRTP